MGTSHQHLFTDGMQTVDPVLEELTGLFSRMDRAYAEAAAAHGFVCAGCQENCCRTLFYHHTLMETLYLRKGVARLAEPDRERILERATTAVEALQVADGPVAVMCPLNESQRCVLYAYRPMICRLHGIPHRLRRPDGQLLIGPGCGEFDRQCGRSTQVLLDRTALYSQLAALEKRLRLQTRFAGKIRMTIAEMLTWDGAYR